MSKRQIRIALCSGILLFALSFTSYGSFTPAPILNPKTYVSPSGEYTLKVDPSTRYGQDEGLHILTRGEKTVWSKTLPFTLWDAAVLDDGVVIGYAYSNGYRGFPSEKTRELGEHAIRGGRLHTVILEANGDFRLNEHEFRTNGYWSSGDSVRPVVRKMLVDVDHDRWVLIMQHGLEITTKPLEWRFFRISDGKKLGHCFPGQTVKQAALCNSVDQAGDPLHQNPASQEDCMDKLGWSMIDCRILPGTPLVLVQWLIFTDDKESDDGVFALINLQGEPVWCLNRPHDYSYKTENNRLSVRDRIWEGAGILDIKPDGKFELWFPSDNALAEFEVKAQGPDWSVREIGRKEYDLEETEKTKKVEYPSIQLKHLGDIKLQAQVAAEEPIRDIVDFDFNDKGQIGFIRNVGCGDREFVLATASGEILSVIPFSGDNKGMSSQIATITWWHDDIWLMVSSAFITTYNSCIWSLNTNTKEIEVRKKLEGMNIHSISDTGPDGYVILAWNAQSSSDQLIAFDPAGHQKWIFKEKGLNPETLFGPTDLTVTSTGEIAVLDRIRDLVQYFNLQGKYLRSLDLAEIYGEGHKFPDGVVSDNQNGIYIYNFYEIPTAWHMNAGGQVTNSFSPRFSDGRSLSMRTALKVAPDGNVWTSDYKSICRLTKEGVVDKVLGETPNEEQLSALAGFTTDHRGWFYMVSERTGCVQVFDERGRLKHICKTLPEDFQSLFRVTGITVDGEGNVYVLRDNHRRSTIREYIRFSQDGTRAGIVSLPNTKHNGPWTFKPGTQDRWIDGYEELYLANQDGEIIRTLKKRPDGKWLDAGFDIAVAPDGSLVILPITSRTSNPVISIFGPQGDPIRTIPLDYDRFIGPFAFSGRFMFWYSNGNLMSLDTRDSSIHSVSLGGVDNGITGYLQFSPDASELWTFSPDTLTVHRYELPRIPDNPPLSKQS